MITSNRTAATPRSFQHLLLEGLAAERGLLLKLLALAFLGALLGLGAAQVSRMAIDQALPASARHLLLALAAGALLVGAHQAWAGWIEDSAATELGARLEQRSLETLLAALLHGERARSARRDAGWMEDTLSGASAVVHAYVASFVALVAQAAFGVTYLTLLLGTAPLAALAVVLGSSAIALATLGMARWEAQRLARALDASSRQRQLLNGLVSSLASARSVFATERLGQEWQRALGGAVAAGVDRARAATLRGVVVSGGTRLLGLAITFWSAQRCLERQLGIGEMLLLGTVAAGVAGSILALSLAAIGYRALRPQFERMNELLAAAPEVASSAPDASLQVAPSQTDDELRLDDVGFRYATDERWVLSARSWRVQRGAFVHLRAPSGSGKSTCLKLLAGLLRPELGQARVFGIEAHRARHLVAYVPQHCELFETTIGENLRILSQASMDEIERIAELTGLSTLLAALPMGMGTPIAARGQNLSSGQRQLIVLSAAFASRRPVLLLDEATSQLDAAARRRIDWAALAEQRTIVAVEHADALA
jgi:ABC-type bacteriocin/lantibiotic exporter with double-glycine peptidase domain